MSREEFMNIVDNYVAGFGSREQVEQALEQLIVESELEACVEKGYDRH